MTFDPDEYSTKKEEIAALDKTLAKLQDCDLSSWDRDFVDDMTKRVAKFEARTNVSPLQWEQIERMRKQYGVE